MTTNDQYLWLEEVEGEKALDYVKKENEITFNELRGSVGYKNLYSNSMEILNSKDKIPYGKIIGDKVYNFWKDEQNTRGVLRRSNIDDYIKNAPIWESVLDIDKLSMEEDENWVFSGYVVYPKNFDMCILQLSRGGKDATVTREFNLKSKIFVENGFYIEEAKTYYSWLDEDTIFISTGFSDEELTDSGYPRTLRILKRGQKLSEAKEVFSIDKSDMICESFVDHDSKFKTVYFCKAIGFYEGEYYYFDQKNYSTKKFPIPTDADICKIFNDFLIIQLKTDSSLGGNNFLTGDLISFDIESWVDFGEVKTTKIFSSTKGNIEYVTVTSKKLVVSAIENICGRIYAFTESGGEFIQERVELPEFGTCSLISDVQYNSGFFVAYHDFLTPATLYYVDEKNALTKIRQSPEYFDSSDLEVKQCFATSDDETEIPYFIIHKKDIVLDGTNPTILYGYGGFEISLNPSYSPLLGKLWLEKGGVYVSANLRGGGEYGPSWHKSVLKENRHKVFEDYISIANDLISKKVTINKHLAIYGRSNGGLLVGATFVKRPDLFKAVICGVPLLDMMRYHKLLAGASWMGEYGDPEDEKMREIILKYSPYQNVQKDVSYPRVFFLTSTKDDRVHPGHARKMVKKMRDMGHDILYYENIDGGHAGTSNNSELADLESMKFQFLWSELK